MKKIFISLPMSGRSNEEIWNDIREAEQYLKDFRVFGDEEIEVEHNMLSDAELSLLDIVDDVKCKNLLYLGSAITKLSTCDAAFFVNGWEFARGCRVEYEACKEYSIPVYFRN